MMKIGRCMMIEVNAGAAAGLVEDRLMEPKAGRLSERLALLGLNGRCCRPRI